jgi:hypothetical protein
MRLSAERRLGATMFISPDWQARQTDSNVPSFPKFPKNVEFEINEKTRFARMGQLTTYYHTSRRQSQPFAPFIRNINV